MTAAERTAFLLELATKLRCPDPEDLVQDVLEKLLRTPPPAEVIDERAWLGRMAKNRMIDVLRRRAARREVAAAPRAEPTAAPAERTPWDVLDEADVRAELAALPAEQRQTFALFAFDGCSYTEIARRLAISKATVGTRILRARARLRALLAPRAAALA